MHRLLPARLLNGSRVAPLVQPLRAAGTGEKGESGEAPGSKSPHIDIAEDDRWLEAEIADKFKTPEERYAFERERQVMRKLVEKVTAEHEEKLQKVVDERNAHVEELQGKIKNLQKTLDDITSK